jgi:glycosyltransferase involved in cell wall biosynthesis
MTPSGNYEAVIRGQNSIEHYDHLVFLGTYNADPFRIQIQNWLTALDLSGVGLVIADNRSTDNTLQWITKLTESLGAFSIVLENDKNFGGYGNLAVNLPKFKNAKWITTLHQDDQYSPEHIQNHRKVINKASEKLGMVCSEAISVTPEGHLLGYPRAHWLLENESDPVTVFLAHLRNHAFPFSGATFLVDVLRTFPIPWHSTAFPDTEIVMKMAIDYRFAFAKGVTVKYLENPQSESHSLTQTQRDFGAFQALIRVFAHPNYERLCTLIAQKDIPNFLRSLDEGIRLRFHDASYAQLCKQAIFEITAQHLGTSKEMASQLAEGYARVGDLRVLETLKALGANTPKDFPLKEPQVSGKSRRREENNALVAKVGAYLPRWLLRLLFKSFMKSGLGRRQLAAWDFDWRKN